MGREQLFLESKGVAVQESGGSLWQGADIIPLTQLVACRCPPLAKDHLFIASERLQVGGQRCLM